MQTKKAIRKEFLVLRNKISLEQLEENSKVISEIVINTQQYKDADTIFLYKAYKNEVLCDYIFTDALRNKKRVAFPRVFGEEMKFFYVSSLEDFEEGYFGILEPVTTLEEVQNNEKGVIIVPGAVFDKKGYRIGYGKGFYDRFLSENEGMYSIGLSHSIQITEEIPREKHDQPLSMIVSEKGIYSFK